MRIHVPQSYTALFWVFCLVIGIVVGCMAIVVSLFVSFLFRTVFRTLVLRVVAGHDFRGTEVLLFVLYNLGTVVVGATLVVCVSPLAAGSGIPNMYAYLNGVDMPAFLTLKVAVVKIIASVLVVSGGLAIGKEGPLLHIGSIVATYLGGTTLFRSLRKTRDQDAFTYEQHARDLVACGAAAGLAAGFKAPVGGMLFAYEMASRWRAELTWRTLFSCAVVATIVRFGGAWERGTEFLSYGSLLFFADSIHFPNPLYQLHWVALIGVLGGLVGSLYTSVNMYIGSLRWRFKSNLALKVLEAGIVSLVTSALRLFLPFWGTCLEKTICKEEDEDCQSTPGLEDLKSFDFYKCKNGTYNDLAVLMFNPQGYVVEALFTTDSGGFQAWSLVLFSLFYFIMAAVTYGMAIPAGLFTPSVIIGGALGQLYAQTVNMVFGLELDVGLYAFLGAGAVLAGLFRFAVSFVVILTELTSTESQLPLLMLVVIIAKGIGDRFNQNILNHLCILLGFPYVGSHPESTVKRQGFTAEDVMNRTMNSFDVLEHTSVIRRALCTSGSEVFPVVSNPNTPQASFLGMVLECDLRKLIGESLEANQSDGEMSPEHRDPFRNALLSDQTGGEGYIDLSPIIRMPPVIIPPDMPLTSVYRLKKSTGLEYIPVIQQHGPLQGMITRDVLLQCQNQLIDPDHLQEHLDRWTDDTYNNRANYEHILGSAHIHPIEENSLSSVDALHPIRRANTIL